ncbi:hypothetical protein [Neobacillus sp. SuZ13]|uniref:hypothetical protein n=1 Tax=Neobacillus sp. SuZ13 TaxID=3047875 RepID=UPI0024C0B3C1|nr:hypothetical protein [Neobacillus sp. SuZ13]WHY69420.1 hypothetical protein QNH17_12575 [Neobacillus sp. SuZ13]
MRLITWTLGVFKKKHKITAVLYTKNIKHVLGSLLGAIAAILQSAGLIGGIGYAFSIMATGPIVLAMVISIRIGLLTYAVTAFLLVILQPSEVLVFLFTTGLLGIALGIGFKRFKTGSMVSLMGGTCLSAGIFILLYIIQFPVLGPSVSSRISGTVVAGVFLFGQFYSWIWMNLSIVGMKYLNKVMLRKILVEKDESS